MNISDWVKSRQWTKKAKAVCKPCWEIKYCPYGPLVEDFPFAEQDDEKRCLIFGHQCPVFFVAEPFTETKELRNISRTIPRVTQFRVLKRENQICRECGNSVKDEEIEFDHIIPWSKGGSSDEYNIRLLCKQCNRKKSDKFEEKYLIKNYNEHFSEFDTENIIHFLIVVMASGNEILAESKVNPKAQDIADKLSGGDLTDAERMGENYFNDLLSFFASAKPKELSTNQFAALKLRWGFKDRSVYSIKEILKNTGLTIDEYFPAEQNLIRRLGFNMSTNKSVITKWKKT
jgi:hypothetical protein